MENRFNDTMLTNAIMTPVNVALVEVTPAIAEEWLMRNIATNRSIRKTTIDKYANDMKAGKFYINPDAITFNQDGELVNGQHRLRAVIKSGKTVKMFVAFGFPITAEALLNVDRGAIRSVADNMELSGISDDVYLKSISTAKAFLVCKLWVRNPSSEQVKAHIAENYDAYARVLSITKMGRSGGSGRMKVVVAAAVLAAYLANENFDALEKFCQVYRTHETIGCEGYASRMAELLREEMAKTKCVNSAQLSIAESYINAFARNSGRAIRRNDYYPIKKG